MPTKLWKKGEPSPNPEGRPKGSFSLVTLLREEIQKAPEGQKQTYAEAFLKKMLHKAIIEGDHASQRLIMNYLEGLPIMKIGGDGTPVRVIIEKEIADKNVNTSAETNRQ